MRKMNLATFFLIILSMLFFFPLVVTLSNSFMTEAEISLNYTTNLSIFYVLDEVSKNFIDMNLIPRAVSLAQYKEAFFYQPTFLILLTNSLKITLPVVIGNSLISLMAAYGFTVWEWKHKEILFFIYIVVMLMPLQAVIVPNYIVADQLGIKDSYLSIILPGVFAPFGTFLLRQSMKAMPREYFEAAKVDGAGLIYILIHIVGPLMKSGVAALAMLVFIEYWNLVEQAIIFIKDNFREPLSVFLSRIAGGDVGLIFATSCIYMVLPLAFLIIGQEDLEKGIELSGIK